jgi:hypothetical protein
MVMSNKLIMYTTLFGSFLALIVFMALNNNHAFALQSDGASIFAPGNVKVSESDSQSASAFAPGALEQVVHGKLPGGGCIASINSPGNLFRQEPTTSDINP